ncbi:hypothetical protein NPIL_635771 [Nephila pilipes]|uniref:Uncharacterized protein n=1 Tax=Nephila pilipes TaxID=299642 RepID=A0A8X6IS78_NEPPI|nr:hypothetical protein NPIL_635771 [Nephila pilipes]
MVKNNRLFTILLANERYLMFRRSPRNPLRYHPVFSTAHYFPSPFSLPPTCARPSDITPRRELLLPECAVVVRACKQLVRGAGQYHQTIFLKAFRTAFSVYRSDRKTMD